MKLSNIRDLLVVLACTALLLSIPYLVVRTTRNLSDTAALEYLKLDWESMRLNAEFAATYTNGRVDPRLSARRAIEHEQSLLSQGLSPASALQQIKELRKSYKHLDGGYGYLGE